MNQVRKAIAGFFFTAGGSLATAAAGTEPVTTNQWLVIVGAGVVTAAGVYYVPNKP